MNNYSGSMMIRTSSFYLERRGIMSVGCAFEARPPQSFFCGTTRKSALRAAGSRQMSSYVLDGLLGRRGGGSAWQWPVTKPNTIFNIVPQGHRYVLLHAADSIS